MDAHELITRYEAGERDFSWANLSGAKVTSEQLGKAASLIGAAMPDGTVHE
jgi:hypothetical protein